ncbi:nitrate- and nitrite sensing domain-containing protein, partial [Streptomyces sp. NRRL WC-3774]|uniref:nitrate- and nitrite sensing domain-containing protein n=1 Tax=Streptomyces sp. NRRL WC-3774 TaxID=1463937 RepID=UPI0004C9AB5C
MRRSPLGRQARAPHGVPPLARLRVGRKLLLLVLLPVTGMLVFTAFSSVAQWREARTLRDFHTGAGVSFAATEVTDAVARERLAAVKARLRPAPGAPAERTAAERTTDRALERAVARAASWSGSDIAGDLDALGRQLHSLRAQTGTGSLTAPDIAEQYGNVEDALLDHVTALESGRPTRASGRAADAHLALLRAIEAAEREQAEA